MADIKIRLTWGTRQIANMQWCLGLFAIHRLKTATIAVLSGLSSGDQQRFLENRVSISLRGVLVWMLVLALAGYFPAAYAILRAQSDKPHNRITYTDLAFPWRWSGLDELRGRALIAQARDELRAGNFSAGFSRLRMGLARAPTDTDARTDLAKLYIMRRLRIHADRVLMEAFDHAYPGIGYVSTSYRTLTYGDNPENELRFIAAARKAHAAAAGPAADSPQIDALEIETWLRLGRIDEAEAAGRRIYTEGTAERIQADLSIALARKDYTRACVLVETWLRLHPSAETVIARAVVVYRLAGRFDDMQACLNLLRKLSPVNPAHAAFNVVQNLLAGRDEQARAALEDGLFRFGADPRELEVWMRDIAETGRGDFLVRLELFMNEHGHDLRSVLFARLLAQVRARDWAAVPETVARLEERSVQMAPGERVGVEHVTTLAMACFDPGGVRQQMFIDAYTRSPVSLEFSRMMIEALLAAGRPATASHIVTLAEGIYPESQYLSAASVRARDRLTVIDDEREKARPVAAASPAAAFSDANALFAEIDRLIRSGGVEDALVLSRAVRKDSPAWLSGRETALALREFDLSVRTNDIALLRLGVRSYLRGPGDRDVTALLGLATGWHDGGRRSESLLVVREILKTQPDHLAALEALEAWDPKPIPVADKTPKSDN